MVEDGGQAGAQSIDIEIKGILLRFSEQRALVGGECLQQWEVNLLAQEIAALVLLSIAETNCAKWRLESVPVGLREKGFEARCYFCFFVLIYNLAAGSPSSGNFGLSVLS
jgi:hypothetical protein